MSTRIQENQLKAVFFIILFISLLLQTLIAGAQSRTDVYKGFTVNFGSRAFDINSNISKIDETSGLLSGGQVGLVFGNSVLRSNLGLLGYYSSGKNTAGTMDLYNTNASVNFYPLALITKRSMIVEPYLTASMDYDQFKFFGYYLDQGRTNYSQGEAPYLGKVKQVNATLGAGVEVRIMDDYDFIHLFSEIRYGRNVSATSSSASFANTGIDNQVRINVGISFGTIR